MEGRKTRNRDTDHEDAEPAVQQAEDGPGKTREVPHISESEYELEFDEDTTPGRVLPRIERLPEGIEVVERPLGHANAQWLLQVRCECGRRWFDLEPLKTATCPRCGTFLMVNIEGRRRP